MTLTKEDTAKMLTEDVVRLRHVEAERDAAVAGAATQAEVAREAIERANKAVAGAAGMREKAAKALALLNIHALKHRATWGFCDTCDASMYLDRALADPTGAALLAELESVRNIAEQQIDEIDALKAERAALLAEVEALKVERDRERAQVRHLDLALGSILRASGVLPHDTSSAVLLPILKEINDKARAALDGPLRKMQRAALGVGVGTCQCQPPWNDGSKHLYDDGDGISRCSACKGARP